MSTPDLKAALMGAFQRLSLREGVHGRLHHSVARLAAIAPDVAKQIPPSFLRVGRGQSEQEIQQLIGALDKAVQAIDALHESAVIALANIGCLCAEFRALLLRERDKARRVELGGVPTRQQRQPRQLLPKGLALYLAHEFAFLTDSRPTIRVSVEDGTAYGPFPELVQDVFAILKIAASSEHWAREASKSIRQHQGADRTRVSQEQQAEGMQRLAAWWWGLTPEERTDPIIARLMEKRSADEAT
jgi:hypothetical protein